MNALSAATLAAAIATVPAAARADAPPTAIPKAARPSQLPVDPVSSLRGDDSAWTVSNTSAGCYLLSPYRRDGSRLAFGRHPSRGLGLFLINLTIAVPNETRSVSLSVSTGVGAVSGQATLIAANVLLDPIGETTAPSVLARLRVDGALWLQIGDAWVMHGGLDGRIAVEKYDRTCISKPAGEPVSG